MGDRPPASGFAETFSQYIVEVNPGGGSDKPEQDKNAEAVLFIVEGEAELTLQGTKHVLKPGGYAFIPPGADWTLHNVSDAAVRFHCASTIRLSTAFRCRKPS